MEEAEDTLVRSWFSQPSVGVVDDFFLLWQNINTANLEALGSRTVLPSSFRFLLLALNLLRLMDDHWRAKYARS